MVALEVMRFVQPSSAYLVFETERKIRVLTNELVHVRNGRFNLLSSFFEIVIVASDFLQLHLLFHWRMDYFSHHAFYNFIVVIESNLLLAVCTTYLWHNTNTS